MKTIIMYSRKFNLHYSLLLLVLLSLLQSCKKDGDNNYMRYPEVEQLYASLPPAGEGTIYGMDMNAAGIIAATFANKLYVSDASGDNWTLINSTDQCYIPRFSEDGTLYVITSNNLIRYDAFYNKTVLTMPFGVGSTARIQVVNNSVYISQWQGWNGVGIYYSTDEGDNWQPLNISYPYSGFCVTPDNHILLAYYNSFSYSNDFGQTWQNYSATFPTTIPNWSGYDNAVKKLSSGRIFVYAMPSTEYYYSDNNGASFTVHPPISNGLQIMDIEEYNGALYAAVTDFDGNSKGGIYKSTDNGTTWTLFFNSYSNIICTNGSRFAFAEMLVSAQPLDLGKGVGISDDNLNSFRASGPQTFTDIADFALDENGDVLIASHGAIYKKVGANWQIIASPGIDNFNKLEITPQGKIAFFYRSVPTWNGKGVFGMLIINPDGSFDHGSDILDAASHSYYFDDQVYCTASGKNGEVYYVEATYSPAVGVPDSYPYKAQKLYKIDGSNNVQLLTDVVFLRQVMENYNGNLFGFMYPSVLYPYWLASVKSTDGGYTWSDFTEDIVPIAFKKTDNSFFGVDQYSGKYYISNPSNTEAYEITFSEQLSAFGIFHPVFDNSGYLYIKYYDDMSAQNKIYRTKNPLE